MSSGSKLLLLFLLCASAAFAQNSLVPITPTFLGPAAAPRLGANLTITFCTSVATGAPCSPLAQAYADSTNSFPINQVTNPLKTDALGNAPVFYAAPGQYSYTITGPGLASPQGPFQVFAPCVPGVSCILASGNTTFSGNNTFSPGTTTIANLAGPTTITGTQTFTGVVVPSNISNEIYMDNVSGVDWCAKFTTAMGLLPSTGGNIITRAQGAQACATAPTVNKPNITLKMAKGIKVPLGTNTFTVPSGTGQYSFATICEGGVQSANLSTPLGCVFSYTGNGIAMKFGDTSARTYQHNIEGITIDLTGAGNAAIGMEFIRAFNVVANKNQISCNPIPSTQQGIVIDGSTEFSDLIELNDDRVIACGGFLVHAINSGGGTDNAITLSGGASEYNCGSVVGSVGVKFDAGGGTNAMGNQVDVEQCPIGVEVASNNNINMNVGRFEGDTVCVQFDSGATNNSIFSENPNCPVTDNSGNNTNNFNSWRARYLPVGSATGLFPAGQSAGVANPAYSIAGETNILLTNATDKSYGVIGVAKAQSDALGARAYAGWFGATYSNNASSPVGLHAQSEGLVAAEFGSSGGVKSKIYAGTSGHEFVETTAPTAVASSDVCYGDSTAHALKCSYNNGSFLNVPQVIASGTAAMTTAAITAGNCGTTVTVSASGVATTDTITWAFNAAPAGSNAGIVAWPTANNVNFAYCSNTAQTPAAATINWRVIR